MTRGAKQTYRCKGCGSPFLARVADRNRGWARFCSKSCKAIEQTNRTGYAGPGRGVSAWPLGVDEGPEGWDGHKS